MESGLFFIVSDTCHWIHCWNQRRCGPVCCHSTGWGSVQSMASSCVWWMSPLAVSLKFISIKLYYYYKFDIAFIANIIFSWFMSSHLSNLQWQCILICSNQRYSLFNLTTAWESPAAYWLLESNGNNIQRSSFGIVIIIYLVDLHSIGIDQLFGKLKYIDKTANVQVNDCFL